MLKSSHPHSRSWAPVAPRDMDTAKNKTESIIIGNCLGCQGLVRIPAVANAKSTVRCPHCGQSYPLQKILIESVPELELLGPESQDVVPQVDQQIKVEKKDDKPREKFVVPVQLSKGAKRNHRHRSRSERSGGKDRPTQASVAVNTSRRSENIDFSASSAASLKGVADTHSRSSRREAGKTHSCAIVRRRQNSSLGETTKILIGGLLAFPIAYLLVFWVFQQDPLNLGPTIGRVVPFAVPAKLRGSSMPRTSRRVRTLSRKRRSRISWGTTMKHPFRFPM